MTAWVQLIVDVSVAEVDVLSGALWAAGAGGIEERPVDDERLTLVIGVPAESADDVADALCAAGLDAVRRDLDETATPDMVTTVSVPMPDGSPDIDLVVDIGRVFGHGGHVTTRLALDALVSADVGGSTVLDLGCGSGVLAIGAARLGAEWVVAVDPSADAVASARANVERNGVAETVEVVDGSVADVADLAAYDVIVANIEAPVLIDVATGIGSVAAPGGRVVLSGFLEEQADRVLAAYNGWTLERRTDEDGWVGLVLRRA